jgi:hypothetical protein
MAIGDSCVLYFLHRKIIRLVDLLEIGRFFLANVTQSVLTS